MGSGGDANEDLYEMLGWGDRAVVIIYCETDSSVTISSFCVVGLCLGLLRAKSNLFSHALTGADTGNSVRDQRCQ